MVVKVKLVPEVAARVVEAEQLDEMAVVVAGHVAVAAVEKMQEVVVVVEKIRVVVAVGVHVAEEEEEKVNEVVVGRIGKVVEGRMGN